MVKFFKKIDWEKIKVFARENKRAVVATSLVLILGVIYVVGKREDNKVILYQETSKADFSTGKVISNGSNIYQKKDRVLIDRLEKLEKQIGLIAEKLDSGGGIKNNGINDLEKINEAKPIEELPPTPPPAASPTPNPVIFNSPPRVLEVMPANANGPQDKGPGPAIISFPVKNKNAKEFMSITLPSGSFVKAKLLTGVEAPEGKTLPVLLQADYAFIGPNKSKIDLTGCFLIAKSTGNLSIERVEMQASKISCVAKSGKAFERDLNGFVADDKDNSFAVIGDVNSKQDRVATMAFLSSIVQGISGAIGQMQITNSMNAAGTATQMITGDESKFIAASGASNAASTITQWYLKHAQGLLPTINIGSGRDVWIVMQEAVDLPNWYFRKESDDKGGVSFITNLLDQQ